MNKALKIAVIGGGASGFFAAIRCAELARSESQGSAVDIRIYESSPNFLSKVRISGGGRCNVTHHEFNPAIFSQNYPRGKRELRSPFTQFQAADTVEWFREKGVKLITEEDGRMFPSSNSSETVIECFMKAAMKNEVCLLPRSQVQSVEKTAAGFIIQAKNSAPFTADKILVATGSSRTGYSIASSLGHEITELAPSLFSFKISHPLLKGLAGTSFQNATLGINLDGKRFSQQGPLLITHRGLSGPAVLKLSAWAAREMKRAAYKARLAVNWSGDLPPDDLRVEFESKKIRQGKSLLKNLSPSFFTKRFWSSLLEFLEIDSNKRWDELSKKDINRLVENSCSMVLPIDGQNRFKEEFVECGGVKLSEVNFKTMESKICPGLHFSGEILDIDGITGGFNFQNAWTTGFIAGTNMAKR